MRQYFCHKVYEEAVRNTVYDFAPAPLQISPFFILQCTQPKRTSSQGMHCNNVTNKAFQKQQYSLLKDYALHNSQGRLSILADK